jgi:hypothetical protein
MPRRNEPPQQPVAEPKEFSGKQRLGKIVIESLFQAGAVGLMINSELLGPLNGHDPIQMLVYQGLGMGARFMATEFYRRAAGQESDFVEEATAALATIGATSYLAHNMDIAHNIQQFQDFAASINAPAPEVVIPPATVAPPVPVAPAVEVPAAPAGDFLIDNPVSQEIMRWGRDPANVDALRNVATTIGIGITLWKTGIAEAMGNGLKASGRFMLELGLTGREGYLNFREGQINRRREKRLALAGSMEEAEEKDLQQLQKLQEKKRQNSSQT